MPYTFSVLKRSYKRNSPLMTVRFDSIDEIESACKKLRSFFNRDVGTRCENALVLYASGCVAKKLAEIIGVDDPAMRWEPKKKPFTSCIADDAIVQDAQQYTRRVDWMRGSSALYQTVMRLRRHLIRPCTEHMSAPCGPTNGYQVYAYEFSDGACYVGLTCNPHRRYETHTKSGPVYKHALSSGLKPALKIIGRDLSWEAAAEMEQQSIKTRPLVLNKRFGGGFGNIKLKWTRKELLNKAIGCSSRKEFFKKHSGPAQAAYHRGMISELADLLAWKQRRAKTQR